MTKQDFVVADGQTPPVFEYHGRTRIGEKVEKLTDTYVTLKLAVDHYTPPNEYKSFTFSKMVKLG